MEDEEFITWEELLKLHKEFQIVVGTNQFKEILRDLGNVLDEEGYIVDATTGQKVESYDLDYIKLKQLGVLSAGSKIFVKNNIANFSQYLSEKDK